MNFGYSTYLEVATAYSGFQFSNIDPRIYSSIERIMYRLPPNYDDGMIINCGTESTDSCLCFKSLIDNGRHYDVVFVDSFHSYEASRRDLELALLVLNRKGTLVVHDCNPPSEIYTQPQSMNGEWVGETYLALLDFVREKKCISYCVVDMDWGCGVIRWKNEIIADKYKASVVSGMCTKLNDSTTREPYYDWSYFQEHHARLLKLKSVTQFKKLYEDCSEE